MSDEIDTRPWRSNAGNWLCGGCGVLGSDYCDNIRICVDGCERMRKAGILRLFERRASLTTELMERAAMWDMS